jgi:hypothetical protein
MAEYFFTCFFKSVCQFIAVYADTCMTAVCEMLKRRMFYNQLYKNMNNNETVYI